MTSKFMKSVKKHLFEIAVVFHCSEKQLFFGKLGGSACKVSLKLQRCRHFFFLMAQLVIREEVEVDPEILVEA